MGFLPKRCHAVAWFRASHAGVVVEVFVGELRQHELSVLVARSILRYNPVDTDRELAPKESPRVRAFAKDQTAPAQPSGPQ